jgi:sugar/nucleoside kinase (ribokinase family)
MNEFSSRARKRLVVTIGNANGEHVLPLDPSKFKLGCKQTAEYLPLMAGGSSVNHACRLLAAGVSVFPILPIVDDAIGQIVVDVMKDAAEVGNCDYPKALFMNGNDLATPFTSILTFGKKRTIICSFPEAVIRRFPNHLEKCLKDLKEKVDAVMIGHIYADRSAHPGHYGACSQRIIKEFYDQRAFIFANFGFSQYRLGATFWERKLKNISCFHLDIHEAREFCKDISLSTLAEILYWFRNKCTIVITMGDLGAIGQLKDSKYLVFVGPYEVRANEIKDSTGTGDAFSAGFVASCLRRPLNNDEALVEALEKATLWRAYALTTFGGANECPNNEKLTAFKETHKLVEKAERMLTRSATRILNILDRTTHSRGF